MRDDGHDDEGVRRKLRGAAQAHRPDRERMRARIERGMAEGERRPERRSQATRHAGSASWLRVVSATAAVAGVFAVVGYGVAAVLRDDEPSPQSVATSTTPRPPTAAPDPSRTPDTPTRRPSGTPTTPPESPKTPKTPKAPKTPKSVPADRLLWADGSIDPGSSTYWSQSDITIKAKKPLTALTVEVRVARSGEVADTGDWRSLPEDDFDVSVAERDGFLVYRWTLKEGRSVAVGEHVFAGQFNHPGGKRDAGADTYAVHAGTSDERAVWRGDFA
ncbi:hypothetical protein [Streptomyces sp. NPDC029674]|uniref:hypothetical protein n=1 Tax=Streptomyces sp. NPDC029674 TaxID=3365297 RepID=UPI0038508CBC